MDPRYPRRWNSPVFTAAIAGDSMVPAYRDGDWVVVVCRRRFKAGQVVALRDPRRPARILVKRLVQHRLGGWWVLGDNPAASTDSRTFGTVESDLVLGVVAFRYHRAR